MKRMPLLRRKWRCRGQLLIVKSTRQWPLLLRTVGPQRCVRTSDTITNRSLSLTWGSQCPPSLMHANDKPYYHCTSYHPITLFHLCPGHLACSLFHWLALGGPPWFLFDSGDDSFCCSVSVHVAPFVFPVVHFRVQAPRFCTWPGCPPSSGWLLLSSPSPLLALCFFPPFLVWRSGLASPPPFFPRAPAKGSS